jgi:hypothetical protein
MSRYQQEFQYSKYLKIIKAAEFYVNNLQESNKRAITPQSLKGSKDLLKIAYGLKPSPLTNIISKRKTLIKQLNNQLIVERANQFDKVSHEHVSYRMAFSLPTKFTEEDHKNLNKIT